MTFNPVFLYHLPLILSFQVREKVRSVGINFSFPINKGRFVEKSWPKRVAWNWARRREGEYLETRGIFGGGPKSQLLSTK